MNDLPEKVTTDLILDWVKEKIEQRVDVPVKVWVEIAFKLTFLRISEAQRLNQMKKKIAEKKLEILQAQEKRNVAAAELEIETTDDYRQMRDQEDKIYSIDEFVRIAKKSSDTY